MNISLLRLRINNETGLRSNNVDESEKIEPNRSPIFQRMMASGMKTSGLWKNGVEAVVGEEVLVMRAANTGEIEEMLRQKKLARAGYLTEGQSCSHFT